MLVTETFHGFIESTQDVLLIFEGCRRGLLPRICRRLQEKERRMIQSGSVFVFDERESGTAAAEEGGRSRCAAWINVTPFASRYQALDGRPCLESIPYPRQLSYLSRARQTSSWREAPLYRLCFVILCGSSSGVRRYAPEKLQRRHNRHVARPQS